jgi:hypothetical protein
MLHTELVDLRRLLENAEAVLNENGHPMRQSDAFSDSDVSESDFAEGIDDLAIYTDCLMDLAPALENPATDLNFKEQVDSKIETFRVSSAMAASYCRKIRDRFPNLDIILVERLGEANQTRSQRIQESLLANSEAQTKDSPDLEIPSGSVFSESCPELTETTKPTYFSESVYDEDRDGGLTKDEYDDVASQTTCASFSTTFSTMSQGRPRVPALPEEAKSGNPFECLACGKELRNIRTRQVWK